MARAITVPGDIDNYPNARLVCRKYNFYSAPKHPQAPIPGVGGRVIECRWDVEYELDENGQPTATVIHPAETISFAENAQGGWDVATELRLG